MPSDGAATGSATCGHCQKAVPLHAGYTPWCACGWNLPNETTVPTRATRNADRLIESIAANTAKLSNVRRRWRVNPIVQLVAAVFLLIVLAIAIAGLMVLWAARRTPLLVIWAAVLLGIAWVLRPRLPKVPKNAFDRSVAPKLFAALDELRSTIGGPRVSKVAFSGGMSSGLVRCGFSRTPVLVLSAPFVGAATNDELGALLAREQARTVSGDPQLALLPSFALQTLAKLRAEFSSSASLSTEVMRGSGSTSLAGSGVMDPMVELQAALRGGSGRDVAAGAMFGAMLLSVVGKVVGAIEWVVGSLARRDEQAASLRADAIAASVVGHGPMLAAIDKEAVRADIAAMARARALRPDPELREHLRTTYLQMPQAVREGVHLALGRGAESSLGQRWRLAMRLPSIAISEGERALTTMDPVVSEIEPKLREALDGLIEATRAIEQQQYQSATPPWKRAANPTSPIETN